jgi:hypothetical protein
MNGVSVTGDRPIDEGKGVGRETCPRQAREVVELSIRGFCVVFVVFR